MCANVTAQEAVCGVLFLLPDCRRIVSHEGNISDFHIRNDSDQGSGEDTTACIYVCSGVGLAVLHTQSVLDEAYRTECNSNAQTLKIETMIPCSWDAALVAMVAMVGVCQHFQKLRVIHVSSF